MQFTTRLQGSWSIKPVQLFLSSLTSTRVAPASASEHELSRMLFPDESAALLITSQKSESPPSLRVLNWIRVRSWVRSSQVSQVHVRKSREAISKRGEAASPAQRSMKNMKNARIYYCIRGRERVVRLYTRFLRRDNEIPA